MIFDDDVCCLYLSSYHDANHRVRLIMSGGKGPLSAFNVLGAVPAMSNDEGKSLEINEKGRRGAITSHTTIINHAASSYLVHSIPTIQTKDIIIHDFTCSFHPSCLTLSHFPLMCADDDDLSTECTGGITQTLRSYLEAFQVSKKSKTIVSFSKS